jgi:hypothetical protein
MRNVRKIIPCSLAAVCGVGLCLMLTSIFRVAATVPSGSKLSIISKPRTSIRPVERKEIKFTPVSEDGMWEKLEALCQLPDSEVVNAADVLFQVPELPARIWLARGLYTRWAELDTAAALASANRLPSPLNKTAREAVLLVMVHQDPTAALSLAKEVTLANNSMGSRSYCPVLAEWGRAEPQAAMAYVMKLQAAATDIFDDDWNVSAARAQVYTLVGVWLEQDAVGFAAWFRTLPDGPDRRFIARRISKASARFMPDFASTLAIEFPGSGLARRTGADLVRPALWPNDPAQSPVITDSWTWETGLALADFQGADGKTGTPLSRIETTANALLEQLPAGVDTQTAEGIRCGVAMAANNWSAAATAAQNFPECSERAAVWHQILQGWNQIDPTSAAAWLAQQPDGMSKQLALGKR